MEKDDVRWALHWPKEDVPDNVLAQYPDLQQVDRQIRLVTESLTVKGNTATLQETRFDIRDFPMNDRIAQREFVRVSGITLNSIEDLRIGNKSWEVFHASEMIVIGIQKRLKDVLDTDHNPYRDFNYRSLEEGDIAKYGNGEVQIANHFGAHLMKYYRDGDALKPIFPSLLNSKIDRKSVDYDIADFGLEGNQLVMMF